MKTERLYFLQKCIYTFGRITGIWQNYWPDIRNPAKLLAEYPVSSKTTGGYPESGKITGRVSSIRQNY